MEKLSESVENYLECILDGMGEDGKEVTVTGIAKQEKVSKPSVNKALNILKEIGYVKQEPYGKISLTEQGREHAIYMKKRHIGIAEFLSKTLELSKEQADIEACRIEHVISDETAMLMVEYKKD